MKKTYKIHPDNILVWPGTVTHTLLWMLLVDRYEISRFWEIFGYSFLASTLILWLYMLWYTDTVDVLKPLGDHK